MKKSILIIILLFFGTINVRADGIEKLQILNIKQGNDVLRSENGKYIIEDYNKSLFLNYKITNYDKNKRYLLKIKNNLYEEEIVNYNIIYNDNSSDWLYASKIHEDTTYEYTLCIAKKNSDDTCQTELDKKVVILNFKDYNKFSNNSKLFINKVVQGGKEIIPESDEYNLNYYYNINSKELVTISLEGENFIDDVIYRIDDSYHLYNNIEGTGGLFYTGKEINEGIDVSIPCSLGYCQSISAVIDVLNDGYIENTLLINNEEKVVGFNTYDDDSIYDYNISVTHDNSNESIFEINPDIYNLNKTYNVLIDGDNFLDKDYSISIEISYKDNLVYEDNITVNGLLLNNNYRYKIRNMDLRYFKDYNDSLYQILIKVDYIYKISGFAYIYPGNIDSELFLGNNLKKIDSSFGSGDFHGDLSGYPIKLSDIQKDNKIKILYSGSLFDDNKVYTYELLYDNSNDNNYSISDKATTIEEGNISGFDLNNSGISFENNLDVSEKNDNYIYTLKILYDDNFVYQKDIIIRKTIDIEYITGDLNNNKKIDLKDIIILIRKYLGSESYTEDELIIGDMNNNNVLDLKDIILLIKIYLGVG